MSTADPYAVCGAQFSEMNTNVFRHEACLYENIRERERDKHRKRESNRLACVPAFADAPLNLSSESMPTTVSLKKAHAHAHAG